MVISEAPNFGTYDVNPAWKIAIVRSVWYDELTTRMSSDAREALIASGIVSENIVMIDAPGSWEIPLVCKHALEAGADGCIAFGVIVQGATHHARLVAEESAAACMQLQLDMDKPITFEVLFVNNVEDARTRAIGAHAKGPLAARTILTSLARVRDLH